MKLLQQQVRPVVELTYINPQLDVLYLNPVVAVTIDERGLNKYARDSVEEIDLATIAFGKALQTPAFPVDALQFALSKALTDVGYAEDEILLSIGFIRDFAETITLSELVTKGVTKPVSDTQPAVDAITSTEITKLLEDEATMFDIASINDGDGLEYSFGKTVSDTIDAPTDTSTLSVGKGLSETLNPTDALSSLDVSKLLEEIASVSEAAALDFTKVVADSSSVADLFDYIFDADRTFADTSSGADAITALSVSKALTEAAAGADAGSLRMTDYADITYFAEDYVGSSRTF